MIKKLIKFSISFSTFSTLLIPNINVDTSINKMYYSDAVKKVNDVRAKIDTALETFAEISNGIEKYRDALNDYNDSTNYEVYNGIKTYVMQNNECYSDYNKSWSSSSSYTKACIYKLFDEEIFLNPYYIMNICASCRYVITSWAGNSWEDMEKWFKDSSVEKYSIYKNFHDKSFKIADLNKDIPMVELAGCIWIDKPNASIYMNIELKSSEQSSPLIKEREYKKGHTGWAVFDSYLFHGKIQYRITDESKEKLKSIKQRIANLKWEVKNEVDKLNAYNPELDRNNDDYESSNLKRILANCEQAHNKSYEFINLKSNNGWIQKF